MNIAVCVVCTVLMVLGTAELVRLLVFWWAKPVSEEGFFAVVEPKSAEECEFLVRSAAERIRWLDHTGPYRLACLNRNADPEIDKICRVLSLRYPFLRVFKSKDLVYDTLCKEMTEGKEYFGGK